MEGERGCRQREKRRGSVEAGAIRTQELTNTVGELGGDGGCALALWGVHLTLKIKVEKLQKKDGRPKLKVATCGPTCGSDP